MTINRYTLYQVFKYALYIFLSMNVYWFFVEEFQANFLLYPSGVQLGDLYDAYAATIDTAATYNNESNTLSLKDLVRSYQ